MKASDFNLPRSEIEKIIDEWIFNEQYRNILKRRLLDGITYEKLSDEFHFSTRHIKNIVYKCEKKLFLKAIK